MSAFNFLFALSQAPPHCTRFLPELPCYPAPALGQLQLRLPLSILKRTIYSHTGGWSILTFVSPRSLEAFNKTINSNDVVVVDAFAEWCGPCKAIAPKVEA